MSAEEKRKVILDIYHKTQQVYTEKEIIALAAKAGVNANSIPEIHQSLVDDGLVEKEKIGGSNYCWAFKAKADRMAQKEHQKTLQLIQQLKVQVEEAAAQLADAKRGREDDNNGTTDGGEDRATKLRRLVELETRKTQIQTELESLKENDPAALADLDKELKLVTEAAHRWTDNIFECKSYLIKKRGMEKKDALKILGITANFDYPEDKWETTFVVRLQSGSCVTSIANAWLPLQVHEACIVTCGNTDNIHHELLDGSSRIYT